MSNMDEIKRLEIQLQMNPEDIEARRQLATLQGRSDVHPEPEKPKHLTFQDGVFIWKGDYETRMVPKEAGFLWHGGRCRSGCAACEARIGKAWWTKREANAARIIQFADAEARKALAKHVGTVAASKASAATLHVPAPKGLRYLPYQLAGIAYALGREGTLIADDMGLGKTIQALGVINADESIRKVLCIVPSSLRLNWLREASKWMTRDFRFYVMDKTEVPPADANFVVLNYAKLAGKGSVAVIEALMKQEWDLLILDEAQYCKNDRAQRTRAALGYYDRKRKQNVAGIAHRCRKRLYLTGTPIMNRPLEVQPLLGSLAPREFGHFMAFAKRYCNGHHNGWGWDFRGASNLEELQERARGVCMIRRKKADVLKELPPKMRQVICVPTNGLASFVQDEQRAWSHHEALLASIREETDDAKAMGDEAAYKAAVARLHNASVLAFDEMSAMRHRLALAKVPAVTEHMDEALQSVDKIILFAHHKDVIKAFEDHFSSWKADEDSAPQNICVKITGDTPLEKRQEAVDRFQTDPSVRVFIGNIKAAGVGWTLTAASTVVFAELDWVPANMTQAEDRAHRIGQLSSVLVQHLVIDGSLDARIAEELIQKQEIADRALDLGTRLEIECPVTPKAPSAKRFPVATPEQRDAAGQAMRLLAGVCDGARALDGMGFSAFDADTGLSLAMASERGDLTDGQVWLATKLARRYHRQLPQNLLDLLADSSPVQPKEDTPSAPKTPTATPKDNFSVSVVPF